jgi:hypothetical protein
VPPDDVLSVVRGIVVDDEHPPHGTSSTQIAPRVPLKQALLCKAKQCTIEFGRSVIRADHHIELKWSDLFGG